MSRVTISLSEDLAEAVRELTGEEAEYGKKSRLFTDALKEYLKKNYPELLRREDREGPTVLEGIEAGKRSRGPSPRLKGRERLEGFRIE